MLLAGLLASIAAPSSGQQETVPTTANSASNGPSEEQRIAQSAGLGQMLYALDRAAWASSDALTAAVAKDQLAGIGGYVVEAPDAKSLRVTYYRGNAGAAQAFFVAEVRAGKVVHQQLLAQPVPLTAEQGMYARAREAAAEQARERAYKPCTPAPFNTVVLPTPNNGRSQYICCRRSWRLAPTLSAGTTA